ncbi:MAG: TonB-dependent receptor [Pseudomonadota bacterium]|nr:TonB-dependent receptor [Pseudomonadota bacterium]
MQVSSIRSVLLGSAAAVVSLASPAFAQDAPATAPAGAQAQAEDVQPSDQEIVVTARRRNEVLLDVPISVTAYTGEQLERQGALDLTDIGDTTPNVTLETSRGTNTTLTAFIRGVGQQDPVAGFEQGVGLYLDDVYLNRPQAAVLDIYDVERIEVLRGPQGTLYGRNTIGGAIKYVTRRLPDEPEMRIRANLGTYKQADLIASASTPLGNGPLKFGASIARLSRGGFGDNLTTGEDNYNRDVTAVRGTLEAEPAGNTFFRLSGDSTWDDSNPRGGHRLIAGRISGAPVLDNVFDTRGALGDPEQEVTSWGATLLAEVGLAEAAKLRSISAYRKDSSGTPIDFDALPAISLDIPAIYRNKQLSQELQLVYESQALSGLVGAYYLDADADTLFDARLYDLAPTLPGLTASTDSLVKTRTWAIFADATFDFSEQFSVSGGARYTHDRRKSRILRTTMIFGGSSEFGGDAGFDNGTIIATTSDFEGSRTDKAFTPRASVSFKPSPDHHFYASWAKGFKGGGFDPRTQTSQAPDLDGDGVDADDIYDYAAFEPEKVTSYELGWKASLLDRRVSTAVALFHSDYRDTQIPASVGCVIGGRANFCGLTSNAGKARIRGIELEGNARIIDDPAAGQRLNFGWSLGYLNGKFKEFVSIVAFEPDGTPIALPGREVDVADFREIQNTPKWTASGTLAYRLRMGAGDLNLSSTMSYHSSSQQFEIRTPMIDQKGFSLLDASALYEFGDGRWTIGVHGNLLNKKYKTAGYNFLLQNPFTGEFILPTGQAGIIPAGGLGQEGVLTAFYGNPRQVFLTLGARF